GVRGAGARGGAVDETDVDVVIQGGQPGRHRGLPGRSPGDDADRQIGAGNETTGESTAEGLELGRRDGDDNPGEARRPGEATRGANHERLSTEIDEPLGDVETEPSTRPGGGEDGDRGHLRRSAGSQHSRGAAGRGQDASTSSRMASALSSSVFSASASSETRI